MLFRRYDNLLRFDCLVWMGLIGFSDVLWLLFAGLFGFVVIIVGRILL